MLDARFFFFNCFRFTSVNEGLFNITKSEFRVVYLKLKVHRLYRKNE